MYKRQDRPCVTRDLHIHGFHRHSAQFGALAIYGSDAVGIEELVDERPELCEQLHSALPITGAEIVWAARHEMARTVDDVLARRTRALFLNTKAAVEMAPRVAELLARELNRGAAWKEAQVAQFAEIAAFFTAPQPNQKT